MDTNEGILDELAREMMINACRKLSDRGLARTILDPDGSYDRPGTELTDKGREAAVAAARTVLAERRPLVSPPVDPGDLDEEAGEHLERIRRNFSRLDSKTPAERSPEDEEELPY